MTSGLLDTSVVIDWHDPTVVAALPDEMAISAITAAELAAGAHCRHSRRRGETAGTDAGESRRSWSHSGSMAQPCEATGSLSPPWSAKDASRVADSRTC